ncbi:MAG: hypothetical protein EPN97_14700 [Alphaproteobacteria bacterium]|nr:MAG: hypothetical protein EPN97_14700 [Alphaproteobacteria bacterium]
MTESMKAILEYLEAFRNSVDALGRGSGNEVEDRAAMMDAYTRLYRLKERIVHELKKTKEGLAKNEKRVCHKILEDNLISGLLDLRTIADHVKGRSSGSDIQIYAADGSPTIIKADCTARSVFPAGIISDGNNPYGVFNHEHSLNAAVRRLEKLLLNIE